MDLSWAWKAFLIVVVGSALLRVAGRKSIAQMTVAQTILMIAIGNLLIQPVSERGLGVTFLTAGVLVLTLLLLEYLQVKFNLMERLITGKSIVVIDNGILNEKNLRRIRMTVDQMEMQLRVSNVSSIAKVKWATIEPNGRIGYMLQEDAQPATKQDLQVLIDLINSKIPGGSPISKLPTSQEDNIFVEVKGGPNRALSPKHLR